MLAHTLFYLLLAFFGYKTPNIAPPHPPVTSPVVITSTTSPIPTLTIAPTETSVPSVTPTLTLTPTPIPTLTPTNSPSPTTTPSPQLTNAPVVNNEVSSYLLNEVNKYRSSLGLSQVTSDSNTCNFANLRAKEISANFNHNGFTERSNSGNLPYPHFSKVTENIAMNGDYKNVVSSWINSPGHAANMRADTPLVCIANYGNYYAYEGMHP